MRRGGIVLCDATQISRYVKPVNPLPGWHSPEQACAQTQGQLAWYRAMEERGEMVQLRDRAGLEKHLALWSEKAEATEGAQSSSSPPEPRSSRCESAHSSLPADQSR